MNQLKGKKNHEEGEKIEDDIVTGNDDPIIPVGASGITFTDSTGESITIEGEVTFDEETET